MPTRVYHHEHGLGALCFENPNDTQKLAQRAMELIDVELLAAVIRNYCIPLVFLEARKSAGVLVETARRFVQALYAELARG